jgi:hypothetical protein
MTGSNKAPLSVPLGDPSPNNDSKELLLPNDPRRRSSKLDGSTGFGGDAAGYIGMVEFGRNRIEDIWPVWLVYER